MLTFKDLQDRTLRWIDEGGDTSTTLALVKDALNASHRRLLTAQQWPFMAWPRTESITTTSGISLYALNPNANRVYHFWDTTMHQYVPVIPRREWPAVGANRSNVATPPFGVMWGPNWPVSVQPTAASTVQIVSSNSADTAVTVIVTGIDSNNAMISETVTANGTTTVTSSHSFVAITNLTKTGTWVGTLTVTAAVDSVTMLTLSPSEYGRWYPTIEFLEDPSNGRTYQYNFQRLPLTLDNDHDIPETPYPFSEIHVYDALLDLTTYNTELGAKEQSLWRARFDELMDGLLQSTDEAIVGSYPRFVRDLDDKGIWSRVAVYNS